MFNPGVKLLMSWDINPGRDQDYFEFVVREWLPGVNKLGIQTVWAWYTVYSRNSDTPQILAEAVADDLESMRDVLESDDWQNLHAQLMEFVSNYTHKIVRINGNFQI